MGWAERLIRLATGDPQQALRDELLGLYRASADRARRLAAHAAQAPTRSSEAQLSELAVREAALRDALQEALRQHGVEPPPLQAVNDGGHNHWARLVADLEATRTARDELSRKRADLAARDPSVDPLLQSILSGLDAQATELRTLIARADPQALN
jgi:hypothetical protein